MVQPYFTLACSIPKCEGLMISSLFYLNPECVLTISWPIFFLFYIDLFTALPNALIYPLTYCQSSPVLMLNHGPFQVIYHEVAQQCQVF